MFASTSCNVTFALAHATFQAELVGPAVLSDAADVRLWKAPSCFKASEAAHSVLSEANASEALLGCIWLPSCLEAKPVSQNEAAAAVSRAESTGIEIEHAV